MHQHFQHLRRDAGFLLLTTGALMAMFTLLRGLLAWRNGPLAATLPVGDLAAAFAIGLRFDLMVSCYILLPLALVLFHPRGLGSRRVARLWLAIGGGVAVFLGVLELDFYREFHTRLNSLVFQYLKEDPATVTRMIWAGFPVVPYLILVGVLWWLLLRAVRAADRATANPLAAIRPGPTQLAWRAVVSLAVVLTVVAGARGSVSAGPPLRWGDAVHSEHSFANHLALNGTFTLIKAASAASHSQQSRWWKRRVDGGAALSVTRALVLQPGDRLELPDRQPIQRHHQPRHGYPSGQVRNIVLIIMESFAGAYVGALGDEHGITPAFDQLADEGLLFTRFFANGTHTHQGMFASVACFPNLPGHEYLMQQPEGLHRFSGLPTLFKAAADNNVYVYNGDFRWDNQAGFFRNQGMDRFIGRDQIEQPKHLDAVWGVSDEDVFRQSVAELDALANKGQFSAIIQTLSNHTPFSLPDPLPVARVTDAGPNSEHLTAMRYSDWALGEFFRAVRNRPWYRDTLFVVVGDHGFATDRLVSAVDLNRFHVPLLLIGPGIREHFGARNNVVGSQVDIVPTAMSLLGEPCSHQCWGRNLLSLDKDDAGFAVVKPSGSDQTAAIIQGADIVTLSPDRGAEKGLLSFSPHLAWHKDENPALTSTLETRLTSYIRAALDALAEDRTGLADPTTVSGAPHSGSSEGSSSLTRGLSSLK